MDSTIIVAFIMGGLGLIGVLMTFLGNSTKTKSDALTAMEARVDKKVGEYMDDLEERLTKAAGEIEALAARATELETRATTAEGENKTLHQQIEMLNASQVLADAREVLMYRYTKALRNHIINELPPPPPTLPLDLTKWFEEFELGDDQRLS